MPSPALALVAEDETQAAAEVTREAFREAMSLLGAPVTLVTTDGAAGRHGLTVSAIASVSDTPPTVLVCLNRANRSHAAFLANGRIGVSILAHGHDAIAGRFASSKLGSEERFAEGDWVVADDGAPLLADALVGLDCTIEQVHASGTHDVLFCRVRAITHGDPVQHGLVWFSRGFHALPRASDD
ncbi:flavin reductase (DIM6/NTAB) family NADH-FMN oxidoreductase RutF [Endobacter medicaginis]|jgi:flavin reductase|uniref:Flavin reductase n=1 Tax=Endobacter medicaginis TaxID=1181271 RepID=A0A839UWV6_9PROT|nr:flavin reductase [Endobacter medicaginis]MBB3174808.1 flavin reductase (DIM6/NTAB) family NADH-FMN oxidoreductase RutF [Endobacter medicaginis]MCX5476007.1 flavin reductase [Endobacter medicaginis]NVN31295.1 flavin reductase [Endobacter medicaginis]